MQLSEAQAVATILVIDDDPDLIVYLETYLDDQGFEVSTATNASDGMALARSEHPDLITLDLSMPGKSGSEFYRELRSDSETKKIPVFIITGMADFRKYIYQRRIDPPEGYMEKPIQLGELLATIRKILGRKGRKPDDS